MSSPVSTSTITATTLLTLMCVDASVSKNPVGIRPCPRQRMAFLLFRTEPRGPFASVMDSSQSRWYSSSLTSPRNTAMRMGCPPSRCRVDTLAPIRCRRACLPAGLPTAPRRFRGDEVEYGGDIMQIRGEALRVEQGLAEATGHHYRGMLAVGGRQVFG